MPNWFETVSSGMFLIPLSKCLCVFVNIYICSNRGLWFFFHNFVLLASWFTFSSSWYILPTWLHGCRFDIFYQFEYRAVMMSGVFFPQYFPVLGFVCKSTWAVRLKCASLSGHRKVCVFLKVWNKPVFWTTSVEINISNDINGNWVLGLNNKLWKWF